MYSESNKTTAYANNPYYRFQIQVLEKRASSNMSPEAQTEYVNTIRQFGAITPYGYSVLQTIAKREKRTILSSGKVQYLAPVITQQEKHSTAHSNQMTISVEEMADLLGICKHTAYALAKEPGFPSLHIGNRLLINKAELQPWLNQQSGNTKGE